MRIGLLGSLAALLAGAGLAWGQGQAPAALPEAAPEAVGAPKPETAPEPRPAALAAPPAGEEPVHLPPFAPAKPAWGRLPPDCLLGPPPGFCPADPCPLKPGEYDRVWLRVDYLLWFLRNDHYAPLATSGAATLPAAVLGGGSTVAVLEGRIDHGVFSGVRIGGGGWLDRERCYGVEANYFTLGQQRYGRQRTSGQLPVLARPFFNLNAGAPASVLIGFPGLATGAVSATSPTSLDGFEVNARFKAFECWNDRVDGLAGFRSLNLDESLTVGAAAIYANSPLLAPNIAGAALTVVDAYRTSNHFYGGQVGAEIECRRECWDVRAHFKVALGSTEQILDIAGASTLVAPNGTVTTSSSGVLAQPSNNGRFSRERFSVIPEAGLELGYRATPHVRLALGYSFLYWNSVVRPGSQADFVVDVSQLPTPPVPAAPTGQNRPAVLFRETDFWAQGFNLSAEFRY